MTRQAVFPIRPEKNELVQYILLLRFLWTAWHLARRRIRPALAKE